VRRKARNFPSLGRFIQEEASSWYSLSPEEDEGRTLRSLRSRVHLSIQMMTNNAATPRSHLRHAALQDHGDIGVPGRTEEELPRLCLTHRTARQQKNGWPPSPSLPEEVGPAVLRGIETEYVSLI
jgi:hypothetical protein